MSISHSEAAASLREVDRVKQRTRTGFAYGVASPHLLLWGAVWIAGYTATGLTAPERWGLVWLPAILVGTIGAVLLGRRGGAAGRAVAGSSAVLLAVAIAAFMAAVYFVFQPTGLAPFLVFPALIVAMIYFVIGTFGLPRFAWIGTGVFAVAMTGFVTAGPWLPFWIAAAGGGGLVLGGLWLRRP